jgi:hypothetical protein
MRYILFLLLIWVSGAHANETKEARSALSRAVMGIPIVKYTKKDIEYKLQQTDYKFLFYLSPVVTRTFRFRHDHMIYYFDFKSESVFIQYRLDF